MALQDIRVPDIGEYKGVSIIEVMVKVGDQIRAESSLLTLETDKATMEVPSPVAGVVKEILVKTGDKVSQGDLIIRAETAAAAEPEKPKPSAESVAAKPPVSPSKVEVPVTASAAVVEESETSGGVHAGPAVRRAAREFGVDLTKVIPSGEKNRIVIEDVQKFVKTALQGQSSGGPGLGLGAQHILGTHQPVKLIGLQVSEGEASLLQGGSIMVGFFRHGGRLVVADLGGESRHQHQGAVGVVLEFGRVSLDSFHTELTKTAAGIRQKLHGVKKAMDDDRLEDVELEVALGTGEADGGVVAVDLGTDHGHGLGLRGIHLAGHNGGAGLVFR